MTNRDSFPEITAFIREIYREPTGAIPLHAPVFSGNEKAYLLDCIDSTFVSTVGSYVNRFEKEICEFTGSGFAVACMNGTAALQVALMLSGVHPGDEVITQPITFIATANAIAYCGAEPVFVDVESSFPGMCPGKLEDWLKQNVRPGGSNGLPVNRSTGKRIAACLPVHVFGHPCDIGSIITICGKYDIPVVEDAAESLGSLHRERHTGTFGRAGILSFNGNKIITTGGGGMILTQDEKFAERAKHLTTQAKVPHEWELSHDKIGYNYRLPNINAAMGVAQLESLDTYLSVKRKTARKYAEFFNRFDEIDFLSEPPGTRSNYWLNTILFGDSESRNSFLSYSNLKGIGSRPVWNMIPQLPMYRHCMHGDLSNAVRLEERMVNLPSSVILQKDHE